MTTLQRGSDGMPRMRWAAWPSIAVALAGIALLVAFQQVVRAGVLQGETRRQTVALRADAEWRCRALRAPGAPVACLLQLDSTPPRDEMPAILR